MNPTKMELAKARTIVAFAVKNNDLTPFQAALVRLLMDLEQRVARMEAQ